MTARVLMVQGTSSSAGKSLLVAALCRIFARRDVRVAPFKAQNMSNNAAVCADGAEIGRSQALQAAAAGVAPHSDMNPVLLKPEAESRSQVIVNGRPWKTLPAREYFGEKGALWPMVTAALDRLRDEYELVVIEGAGSPAELNLRTVEIVNMAIARYCRAPVLLVGDIERGGVFAQLLGTLWLLSDEERALVRGLIVNKFRGDLSLFDSGRAILQERGGVPVVGVIPWVKELDLPEEDAEGLGRTPAALASAKPIDIVVIQLPRISNFDDFAPLAAEANVSVRYVDRTSRLGDPDVVILPGTKSTMSDLEWLQQTGLAGGIQRLAESGAHVVGICGGYQMLGQTLRDPQHVESSVEAMPGLGMLPTTTTFAPEKETFQVRGRVLEGSPCAGLVGQPIEGYEIHMGRTHGGSPWLELTRHGSKAIARDGASARDGRIWGCYVHGLFASDAFRREWLETVKGQRGVPSAQPDTSEREALSFASRQEASLERLANAVESALDWPTIEQIIQSAS
jgi:adenosylcobyric acid synthase